MTEQNIMSRQETEDMILDADTKCDKALIAILWNTGHRISEILELERSDIWYDDKWIWFRLKVGKRRLEFIHTIKIPRRAMFVSYIVDYHSELNDNKLFDFTRQYVDYKLKKLNPRASAHKFRHSLATRLAEKGANRYQLDAFFGWSEKGNTSGIYVSKGTALIEGIANMIE